MTFRRRTAPASTGEQGLWNGWCPNIHHGQFSTNTCGGHQGLKTDVRLTENEVGAHHVEHGCQRAADVVERDVDIFQAEVVEGDHADEHKGERQNLKQSDGRSVWLSLRGAPHDTAASIRARRSTTTHVGGRFYMAGTTDTKPNYNRKHDMIYQLSEKLWL